VPSLDVEKAYSILRLIRRAEEKIAEIYPSDKIKSPVHLSIGQESVAVGICQALRADDAASGTYRGHATYLAKGGNLNRMIAELYGKSGGITGGKGGSMHLIDMEHMVLGTSAVVGTTVPIALGYALAFQKEGKGRVVAAFFGDGATEEGVFSESLNFAALHKLPVLFVCENNGYAIHTPSTRRWAQDKLSERVETYGIPTTIIEDSDVFAIHGAAEKMIAAMRKGGGPGFLECKTYRWYEHVGPNKDYDAGYRSEKDMEKWRAADQVEKVGAMLPAVDRTRIDAEVEALVAEAIDFAETSPFPELERVFDNIYSD